MWEVILVIILSLVTFIFRIVNLLGIPIFTDEAIYVRWAQIGLADPAHRYISLTDGKQPLLTWLMYPFLYIFQDPLFAGRFVSVLSSVFAVVGIYLLSRELFGKKTAIFASLIYLFSPFTTVYDRLALMDGLLASLCIWCLYLEILLVRFQRLDTALLLGMTIGAGLLTKSSASFFLYLMPASLILFDLKEKKKFYRFLKWLGLAFISFIIAQVIYNSLRLSPWFYIIEQKNHTFIITLDEFLISPFTYFLGNLHGLLSMFVSYLTIPITLTVIAGCFLGIFKKEKKILYLFLWFIIPFLSLAAFGKILFPRFILFMVMPLFVIAAYFLSGISSVAFRKARILFILVILIFIYPAYQSFILITSPVDAAIPSTDRNQLFDQWPSGYGVKEVISYLKEKSASEKIVVGTEGTFGLFPAALEIYLGTNKNVEIHGFWPVGEVPQKLVESALEHPTFLIFKERKIVPDDWPLTLVAKYRRGKGDTYLLFYRVNLTKKE